MFCLFSRFHLVYELAWLACHMPQFNDFSMNISVNIYPSEVISQSLVDK